jgi:hypothetical protein
MADRKKAIKAAIDFSVEGAKVPKTPVEKKPVEKKPLGKKFAQPKGAAEPKTIKEADSRVQKVVKDTGATPGKVAAQGRVQSSKLKGDATRAKKPAAAPKPVRTEAQKAAARKTAAESEKKVAQQNAKSRAAKDAATIADMYRKGNAASIKRRLRKKG